MADFEEKRYSIDPGKGKKMDGCPYSNFEDGHDVQEYIIPPKGYVFSGFRFDPDASNQIYDGKLYAIYTKEPFNIRLKSNLWKLMLALIVAAVIGLIILLVFSVFKKSSTTNEPAKEPKTEIKAKPADKKKKKDKKTDQSLIEKKEDKAKATSSNETENTQTVQETPAVTTPEEKPQNEANDPNVYFKQEFWALIHQRVASMDDYHNLYVNYKDKVSGEEFEYLRTVILENYAGFKKWYDKLKTIPDKQLNSIYSITELSRYIN